MKRTYETHLIHTVLALSPPFCEAEPIFFFTCETANGYQKM